MGSLPGAGWADRVVVYSCSSFCEDRGLVNQIYLLSLLPVLEVSTQELAGESSVWSWLSRGSESMAGQPTTRVADGWARGCKSEGLAPRGLEGLCFDLVGGFHWFCLPRAV